MEKLQKELGKGNKVKTLVLNIMTDDQWCAKAIAAEKRELYKFLDTATFDSTDETNEQIAGYILEGIKDIGKGKSAIERGGIIITTVSSFMNEDKSELTMEDYANALVAMRTLKTKLFSDDVLSKLKDSRKDNGVKGFTPKKTGGVEPVIQKTKTNSFISDIEKATELMEKDSSISGSKDEIKCAEKIKGIIDKSLKSSCGCRNVTFSNWAAEQIYKLSPTIKELIAKADNDVKLVENMFSIWVENMKVNDQEEYLHYIDDASDGIVSEVITDNHESKVDNGKLDEIKADIQRGMKFLNRAAFHSEQCMRKVDDEINDLAAAISLLRLVDTK